MDKVISATLKVIGVLAFLWVVYFLRDFIVYFLFAFIIASALRPPIDFLEKKKIARPISAVVIFILFLLFVSLIIFLVLPPFINETQNLIEMSPEISQRLVSSIKKVELLSNLNLTENLKNSFSSFFQEIAKSFTSAVGLIYKLFGGIFNAGFIIIISFYFAAEKEVAEKISKLIASENQKLKKKVFDAWNRAERIAGRWLYSYFILGTIVGVLVYIGLSLIGVRYALILAFIAGIFEIVPFIGPILSGIIGSVLALFQGGFGLALWSVLVFVIVQQLENFLIVPFVMKKRIDMHPILVIIILFIAGKVFGPLGAILSVPFMAILIAIVKENYSDYFIERRIKPLFIKRN